MLWLVAMAARNLMTSGRDEPPHKLKDVRERKILTFEYRHIQV